MSYFRCVVRKEEFVTITVKADNVTDARRQMEETIRESELLHGRVTYTCIDVTASPGVGIDDLPPETSHCPRCGQRPRVEPVGSGWNAFCPCETPAIGGIAPELDQAISNWNMAVCEVRVRTRDEADKPKPLPCPTCGDTVTYWIKGKVWTVGCGCLGQGRPTGVSEDREEAIRKWNEAVTITSEALPCPGCHNVPSCGTDDEKLWTCECMFCPPRRAMRGVADDKNEAISRWNDLVRSAPSPAVQEDVQVALPNTLPCPVCCNEPSCEKDEDELWTVKCMICRSGDHVGVSPDDEAGAIDSWNDAVRPVPA